MKSILLSILIFSISFINSQVNYFPPLTGTAWESENPNNLGWCQPRIDSLYNYLEAKNTKSFIIIKDGKIVLEKYFGSYTIDSLWYWASSSKCLSSFITGMAQEKGFININNPASQYLGAGWTTAPLAKENLIAVKHLLEMTSGLEDVLLTPPCTNEDPSQSCLIYKVDAGTRWAYHTGPYKKLHDIVATSVGQNYNTVTNNWVKQRIGMGGLWLNQTYFGKARDMARFGLLNLNKGIWNNDTLMKDTLYFKNMINTSQNFNLSYGYLWWLNGKSSFMSPGLQLSLNGPLIPNAPSDMYAALGKNDQKIYVVPSTNMVVVRQGNSAEGVTFALSTFDNKLWDYINKLNCNLVSVEEQKRIDEVVDVYPNPIYGFLHLKSSTPITKLVLYNCQGQAFELEADETEIATDKFVSGIYLLVIELQNKKQVIRRVLLH